MYGGVDWFCGSVLVQLTIQSNRISTRKFTTSLAYWYIQNIPVRPISEEALMGVEASDMYRRRSGSLKFTVVMLASFVNLIRFLHGLGELLFASFFHSSPCVFFRKKETYHIVPSQAFKRLPQSRCLAVFLPLQKQQFQVSVYKGRIK